MPIVHGVATDPGGNPVAGAKITAQLVSTVKGFQVGFASSSGTQVVGYQDVASEPADGPHTTLGYWEMELVENALIDHPTGTAWRIAFFSPANTWGPGAVDIVMDDVGGEISTLIASPEPPSGEGGPDVTGFWLGTNRVDAIRHVPIDTPTDDGTVPVYVLADGRIEWQTGGGGGGSGDATSIRGRGISSATPTYGQMLVFDEHLTQWALRNPGATIDIRDVPDIHGNVAACDGTTHDGLAVAATVLFAHANKLKVTMPSADILMLDPDGNPVLIQFDQHAHPWPLDWGGAGRYTTTLHYPADLGLVTDPTDLTLCGDPSGRVSNFAVDCLYANNTNHAPHLHDFGAIGHFDTEPGDNDPQSRARGWFFRMGGRARAERLYVANFHASLVYRCRKGSARPDQNIDHNDALANDFAGCAYHYYWNHYNPVSGMNTGDGDHVIGGNGNSGASQASVAAFGFDASAVLFDSSIVSVHRGAAPYGMFRESGPKGDKTLINAQVSRDNAGVVTLVTNDPGGPSTIWPGRTVAPAYNFLKGDVVKLVGLGLTLASDTDQVGRITNVSTDGTGTLTFLMEAPIASSPIGSTDVSNQSIRHFYNNVTWLQSNEDHDGSFEGCGTSFIHCADGDSTIRGYDDLGALPMHGNEVIGRNVGTQQAVAVVPLLQMVRVNTTNPGHTGVDGDVMTVTATLPTGTVGRVDDVGFFNTPTSGPWKDDNPQGNGWTPDPDRMRGKWILRSAADNGTHCTFTYFQVCSAARGHFYTEKTLGDGTPGSAGFYGQVAGIVCGDWIGMSPSLHILHENQSGRAPSEYQMLLGGQLRRSDTRVTGDSTSTPVVLNVRSLPGTTDAGSSEPVRSALRCGTMLAHVAHNVEPTNGPTSGLILPGQALELSGRADVRLYRGGQYAGMALYRRLTNDYTPYMVDGHVRGAEYGIDFPQDPDDTNNNHGGAVSRVPFSRGDVLAPDPTDPGMWRLARGGDIETLYASATSVGPRTVGTLTNVYITQVKTLRVNGIAPTVPPSNVLQSSNAGNTATTGDTGPVTMTFDPLFRIPSAGEILVVAVNEQIKAGTSAAVTAVSGCGATWVQLYRHINPENNQALEVWIGTVGGSPSVGPVQFSIGHSNRTCAAQLLYITNVSGVHDHHENDDGGTASLTSTATWTPTTTNGVDVAFHCRYKGNDATVFDAASSAIRLNSDYGTTGNIYGISSLEEPRSTSGTPITSTATFAAGLPNWIAAGLTFTYSGAAAPVDVIDGGVES